VKYRSCFSFAIPLVVLIVAVFGYSQVEPKPGTEPGTVTLFPPLAQWREAVLAGDSVGLKVLYSTTPAARVITPSGETNADAEISFWSGLRARNIKLEMLASPSTPSGVQQVVMQADVLSATPAGDKMVYVTQAQVWQKQGENWRLVAVKRTDPASLQQPASTATEIYPAVADAHAEIKKAEELAARDHKRVLIVFGANWCYDCHVLDLAFHREDLVPVLTKNYEVVHVDVGKGDKNQDLMKQYGVPMDRGIPGLAVLESDGKVVYSQKNGEFENARSLTPEALLQFLNQWKPAERQSE